MKISCPECDTKFAVNADAIGESGRKVKCVNCGKVWFQEPFEEDIVKNDVDNFESNNDITSQSEIDDDEDLAAYLPKDEDEDEEDFQFIKPVPWFYVASASILLILCLVTGMIAYRENFPALKDIYKKIGIIDNKTVVFSDVVISQRREGNKLVVTIDGVLVNKSSKKQKVPPIRINTYTKGNHLIDSVFDDGGEVSYLKPNERFPFSINRREVSGNANRMTVDMGDSWELYFR
jgi:predicted Zn finger-like uncharacterized protein